MDDLAEEAWEVPSILALLLAGEVEEAVRYNMVAVVGQEQVGRRMDQEEVEDPNPELQMRKVVVLHMG